MQYKKISTALFVAGGLLLGSTSATALDRGTMLANTCAGCHGTYGASVGPATPTIAGMTKDTIIEAMKGYASGDRPSTIMGRIAKGYTEKDYEAMAEYFTKQKFVPAEQEVDAAQAKVGGELHEEYCEKCHEDNGRKDDEGTSILAGQWMPYLRFSLNEFADEERYAPKKMMRKLEDMIEEHGRESLEQVVHFYGNQK